jgi:hypothetical protein
VQFRICWRWITFSGGNSNKYTWTTQMDETGNSEETTSKHKQRSKGTNKQTNKQTTTTKNNKQTMHTNNNNKLSTHTHLLTHTHTHTHTHSTHLLHALERRQHTTTTSSPSLCVYVLNITHPTTGVPYYVTVREPVSAKLAVKRERKHCFVCLFVVFGIG